jgi:flagellar protein FlgJ
MTLPVDRTSFYADPQALSSLKREARAQDPAALKEAAKQFESLFTQMLLKSMREASKSFGDSMFGSDQADFYQGLFDDQMALHLSQGKGLGLADMLFRQLMQSSGDGERIAAIEASAPAHPGNTTHRAVAQSKEDFVRTYLPYAEQAARELGVDARALLAQAALETGWGKSVPCTATGECSYNFFGIKATGRWSGATVSVPTLEFEDGLPVRKAERFRAYSSPADSFRDYAALIRNNPRYGAALGAGSDVASFASALQRGGYATDPEYADKIVAVAREVSRLAQSAVAPSTAAGIRT